MKIYIMPRGYNECRISVGGDMRGITITDSTQDGRFLAFDLIDILRPLKRGVMDSEW